MKQTILLILAMCFAFAMPAQASEGYEGFSPAASFSVPVDSALAKVTDNAVIGDRSARRQPEAAEFNQINTAGTDLDSDDSTGNAFAGNNLPYEVGRRRSANTETPV
jgi:hypothetical protein